MAAFTSPDPTNREAFMTHWERIQANSAIVKQTIVTDDGEIAGNVMLFELFGQPSIAYWLGKDYWGQGLATKAVQGLMEIVTERPLFARVAHDNNASKRVLEKCGFQLIGREVAFAEARQAEIEELILRLD